MITASGLLVGGVLAMLGVTGYAFKDSFKHVDVNYEEEYYNKLFKALGITKDDEYVEYVGVRKIGCSKVIQFKLPLSLTTSKFETKHNEIAEKMSCEDVSISYAEGIMSIRQIEKVGEVPQYMYEKTESYIIPIGWDGDLVKWNIRKDSHILAAGASNSGKSTLLNMIICHMIQNRKCKLWLVDLKQGVEFTCYKNVDCVDRFVKDIKDAEQAISDFTAESVRRYEFLVENGYRNYWQYYDKVGCNGDKLGLKVMVIDEVADILAYGGKLAISNLIDLARKCRGVGMSLVVATQKPTADAIPTAATTNITARVCFRVVNSTASNVVLDMSGAEKLKNYECIAILEGQERYFKSFDVQEHYIERVTKKYNIVKEEEKEKKKKGGVK